MDIRKIALAAASIAFMIFQPAYAASKAPATVISKWITHWAPSELLGEAMPGKSEVYTLSVRGKILSLRKVSYDDDEDASRGVSETVSVALSNVTHFDKNEYQSGGQTYHYIGITTKTDHDITDQTTIMALHEGGYPGFGQFGPEQGALRDDVYAKLCALIGQTP
ncbi:MAG: hypothetical protein ACTHPD_05905 [Rhizomicrobium sp.]